MASAISLIRRRCCGASGEQQQDLVVGECESVPPAQILVEPGLDLRRRFDERLPRRPSGVDPAHLAQRTVCGMIASGGIMPEPPGLVVLERVDQCWRVFITNGP